LDTLAEPYSPDLLTTPCIQTLVHHGHPRAIQRLDIAAFIRLATEAAGAIEMTISVGDVVLESTPMLRVMGGTGPIPEEALRSAIELGAERTFDQDPKYAIRLLVDIAIRALSPAVNDPTTAVQALNEIEDLLLRLGRRRLEIGTYRDTAGNPKFLMRYPTWEDFLRLALDEIRFYGANSVQVMRRMKALIAELLLILPEERSSALHYWQARLQSTVHGAFSDKEDVLDASDADRQGLGTSHRLQTFPFRATARKILPSVTLAARVHWSSAALTQCGMGTVRIWPPLPTRSTTAPCPWRIWISSHFKPTSSERRKPQPKSMASIA